MELRKNDMIALAAAGMVAATIWVIWLMMSAPGELKAEHWLGFLGNVFGGGMTLLAALAAWLAVRGQNAEQRRSTEIVRRDAANTQLSIHMTTLFTYRQLFTHIFTSECIDQIATFHELQSMKFSEPMLKLVQDHLLGRDADAISQFLNWTESAARQEAGRLQPKFDGRVRTASHLLYHEIAQSVAERRKQMRLHGVDTLAELKLIDLEKYMRFVRDGTIPLTEAEVSEVEEAVLIFNS